MKRLFRAIVACAILLGLPSARAATPAQENLQSLLDEVEKAQAPGPADAVPETADTADFAFKLDVARRLRLENNNGQATRVLVSILEADAPEELKHTALLELALVALQQDQPGRAQQILSQFVKRYPDDPGVPAVLLQQGLLYRQMGAQQMALSKLYAVMTTALNLKSDHFEQYQRLVTQAQVEIAETQNLLGNYAEAADSFDRLLKQGAVELDNAQIECQLVRCLRQLNRHADVVTQAQDFLSRYPGADEAPEVRFFLAHSLQQLQRDPEAVKQVLVLLAAQHAAATREPARWIYWQKRAGNEIGNQFYSRGDFADALEIYSRLAEVDPAADWQVPVLYQVGLVSERLHQPQQALAAYQRIIAREKELQSNPDPNLHTVLDMAKWRKDYLAWLNQAEQARQTLNISLPQASSPTLQ